MGALHLLPRQALGRPHRRPGHRKPEALVPLRRLPPLANEAGLEPLLQGDVRPHDAVLEPGAGGAAEVLRDPAVLAEQVHRVLGRLKLIKKQSNELKPS